MIFPLVSPFWRIPLFTYCSVQFLNGGNNKFGIIGKLFDQSSGVFCAINTAFVESIKFFCGLVIQVFLQLQKLLYEP